jgi:perosamine synthetase
LSYQYPVYRPRLTGRERELVLECIDSTWISSKGKFIGEFESKFADFIGAEHALSVSNGTVALHVALEALGIGPGDEVIVPTLTYIASVNAILYTGATPVFVDSEQEYWQLSVDDVRAKITERTKAIMPVHLYGQACDMEALVALAAEHSIYLVEDCAEALGTRIGDRFVGTFGDVATFSFFGNKTITTGEGGMVVAKDPAVANLISRLKGQGLAANREYWHDIVGYNYRMTNICAAIGCAQMEDVEGVIAQKQRIAEWYAQGLTGLPLARHAVKPGTFHSFWMVSVITDAAEDRDPLREHLKAVGVETRPLFYPVHTMSMYGGGDPAAFPVADHLSRRGLNLPSYPDLTEDDVSRICGHIRAYFSRNGRP